MLVTGTGVVLVAAVGCATLVPRIKIFHLSGVTALVSAPHFPGPVLPTSCEVVVDADAGAADCEVAWLCCKPGQEAAKI